MKMFQCVSSQELLTRTFHVLSVFLVFQRTTLGLKSQLWKSKFSSLRERSPHKHNAIPVHKSFFKRSTEHHTSMSDVHSTYSKFYDEWLIFSESIPNKLNSKTPCTLWSNVGAIAQIITPSDHAFYTLDVDEVIKRIMLTLRVAKSYLQTLEDCRYIRRNPESQRFFTTEKNRLDLLITIMKFSLMNLRYSSMETEVTVVHAGLGQINSGSYQGMRRGVLRRVRDLILGLKSGKC